MEWIGNVGDEEARRRGLPAWQVPGRLGLAVVAGLGVLVTLALGAVPDLAFAWSSVPAHVAIEVTATLVAGLAAALFVGRALRTGRLPDLLLMAALGLMAASSLLFSLVPALAGATGSFATWAPLLGRLVAAACLTAAAFAPAREVEGPRRAAALVALATAASLALVAAFTAALGGVLPVAADAARNAPRPDLAATLGPAPVAVVQAVLLLLAAAATVGFARAAAHERTPLLSWLALSALLLTFARVNHLLLPPVSAQWVHAGDLFRLAAYLTLLVAVALEVAAYQRRLPHEAVLAERRRLARELHDGPVQELAFIRAHTERLRVPEDQALVHGWVLGAADHALEEARHAIAALRRPVDEPLEASIEHLTDDLETRLGTTIELELERCVQVSDEVRHAATRIVREAVHNAVRHGAADTVRVELRGGRPLALRIVDDGSGFDPSAPARTDALGLVSMRERAEALGGSLTISSAPGRGTALEVVLP